MSNAIAVTSIHQPTECLKAFSREASTRGVEMIVAGDRKSPADFVLAGTYFMSLEDQAARFPDLASKLPYDSYARKNIAYVEAMRRGATMITDTDDDNSPRPDFWNHCDKAVQGRLIQRNGWVNAYAYFTDAVIWPRGLPLNEVREPLSRPVPVRSDTFVCPIQQGLADDNPDVDALYRLLMPLPVTFDVAEPIVLDCNTWCPFNSQNTRWWPEAYPLLYLPAYCSFRMTDIWRSFVAQRILWENDWRVSFHSATVYQDRNEHNLMRDFEDELSGYRMNGQIRDTLLSVEICRGTGEAIGDNLRRCYAALIRLGVIGGEEMPLLDSWIAAVKGCE